VRAESGFRQYGQSDESREEDAQQEFLLLNVAWGQEPGPFRDAMSMNEAPHYDQPTVRQRT
jgi:NADH:ubiquinone oxidoreductase subunit F (NADH-binding)